MEVHHLVDSVCRCRTVTFYSSKTAEIRLICLFIQTQAVKTQLLSHPPISGEADAGPGDQRSAGGQPGSSSVGRSEEQAEGSRRRNLQVGQTFLFPSK